MLLMKYDEMTAVHYDCLKQNIVEKDIFRESKNT